LVTAPLFPNQEWLGIRHVTTLSAKGLTTSMISRNAYAHLFRVSELYLAASVKRRSGFFYLVDVRFGSKADVCSAPGDVR